MQWFKKAWAWIKEHWQIVLGALGAIIAGWLAWGAYSRKVGKLKDAVEVEKAVSDVKRLEAKREVLEKQEQAVEKKDVELEQRIVETKKKAVKVRENVNQRSDQEIADRFNELYR
jgi:hypothetical protein